MIERERADRCPTCGEVAFSGWTLGHHYCDSCHQTFDDDGTILCEGRFIDNRGDDDYSQNGTERLKQAVKLMDKSNDMECHWSPYCSREGVGYVKANIGRKPFEVWSCKKCNWSADTDTDRDGGGDENE